MELSNLGKLPIAGLNPTGNDIRTHSIYEDLTNEINKHSSISSAERITNWQQIVKLSEDILQNYSKDILVCSYLCVGLLKTQGIKGFATGLHIYRELLETYWEKLYPPRLNGRINALDWWIETVNEQLPAIKAEVWTEKEINNLNNDFEALITFFDERDIDKLTEIRAMLAKSMTLISTKEVEDLKSELSTISSNTPGNSDLESVGQSVIVTDSIIASKTDTQDSKLGGRMIAAVEKSLPPIFSALGKITDALYQEQPLPYMLFKINRFIAWINISNLPASDSEAKTMLPPPDQKLISRIQQFYQDKNWLELLKLTESHIIEFPFWLDLSYYSYEALNTIDQADAAVDVLVYETLIYIKRLKGIETLMFTDGTAFANSETQEWLAKINCFSAPDITNMNLFAYQGDNLELTTDIEEAKQLVMDGDLPLALNKLHYKIQSSLTKHAHFVRILYFCQFVNSIERVYLAKPYIQELLECSKTYQLEVWEPQLASQALQLILSISRQESGSLGDIIDEPTFTELLDRLIVLDPAAALKFYS